MSKAIDESKIAAANYILDFYKEVSSLTHNYANYENLMLEMEISSDESGNVELEKKDIMKQQSQNLRYFVIKTQISYTSIMSGINSEDDKDIKTLFDKIKSEFVIKRDDIYNYVVKLNGVLVKTIMKNLLQSSQEVFNKIYNKE